MANKNFSPKILVQPVQTIAQQAHGSKVEHLQAQLISLTEQLAQLEQRKPKPPNPALYFFDQEKRQEILFGTNF